MRLLRVPLFAAGAGIGLVGLTALIGAKAFRDLARYANGG